MFKKAFNVILVILILGSILFATGVFKNDVVELAFAQVKEFVKEKPQPQINEQVMQVIRHVKNKENDQAIKLGKEYLSSNPNDITAINILTEAYINSDDLSSAEETIKKALAIQPNDPWSCRLAARTYRLKAVKNPEAKNENLNLALEHVSRALANNPEDIWLLAEGSQAYSDHGDKVKANAMIDSAIRIAPNEDNLKAIKANISLTEEERKLRKN